MAETSDMLRIWGIEFCIELSFEAFTAVIFHFALFWVVTPCIGVVGYQRFRCSCCLYLQFTSPWRWKQYGPPKRWYPATALHGVTTRRRYGMKPLCYEWRKLSNLHFPLSDVPRVLLT